MSDFKSKSRLDSSRRSLSRVMSKQGLCSRSDAEKFARSGMVKVNGKFIRSSETLVALDAIIELVGAERQSSVKTHHHYIVMNKRRGLVTTSADELGRATVYGDLQKFLDEVNIDARLFAVGRLDKETEGLLLFTNDNEFADWLTSPKNHVPKTYLAELTAPLSDDALEKLKRGVVIDAQGKRYTAKPSRVKKIKPALVEITLTEGKNREVRRLFDAVGNSVKTLVRTGFAGLCLDVSTNPPTLDGTPLPSGATIEIQKQQILNSL